MKTKRYTRKIETVYYYAAGERHTAQLRVGDDIVHVGSRATVVIGRDITGIYRSTHQGHGAYAEVCRAVGEHVLDGETFTQWRIV